MLSRLELCLVQFAELLILGYSFTGTGDWILQDGTWSYSDLTRIFKQPDVELALNEQKGLRNYLHCY